LFKLGQNDRIRVRASLTGPAQLQRVRPHLRPRLAKEALRAQPVERLQQPVQPRAPRFTDQLVILMGNSCCQHAIDRPVIRPPARQQSGVPELVVGDDGQ
jgi:hypothetical protein